MLTARLTPAGAPGLTGWSAAAAPQPAVPAVAGMEGVGKAVVPELWNLQAHVARYYALPDNCIVTCGAFAPDESVFFTGGTDNLVHVWAVPAPGEASRLLEAQITFVGSQVEGGTGLVQIQAELENPSDPSRRLRPGSRVHLTLYPETGRRR